MSIEAMISEHPQVGAAYNETLGRSVRKMVDCGAICNSCADACMAEPMDMAQCVRLCMDCADICTTAARVAMRRTGSNRHVIRTILAVCIEACEFCATECARHDSAHCRRCARMCEECTVACREALADLNREVHAET